MFGWWVHTARPLQQVEGLYMRVERATVQNYRTVLTDKYRPPSKGGNTRAWHRHSLTINDESYSFWALGAKRWVYASDTVTFEGDVPLFVENSSASMLSF